MLTERDMRNILRHRCEEAGGQRKWAETHGFSAPYVNLVLCPLRLGSPKVIG